jgi:penicillin-binding protein 2
MFAAFVLAVGVVLARLWSLEVTSGEQVRAEAARPLTRVVRVPARRGKIVTRDGIVLARDRELRSLQLHYRYLEEPPNAEWLTYRARRRLPRAARRDPRKLAAAKAELRVERADLHRRLAALAGVSLETYNAARRSVQQRVERIARDVNRRHRQEGETTAQRPEPTGWWAWLKGQLAAPPETAAPRRIVVAEELDYHTIIADLPPKAAAEIKTHPDQYPGVKIDTHRGRDYPQGSLAAHLIGHLGALNEKELAALEDLPVESRPYEPKDQVGRTGLELQYETTLRGRRGLREEQIDRRGETLAARMVREPAAGDDLVLTLDARLQQSAERLLDAALARRASASEATRAAGGAAVVLDCRTGAVLACASAPRFDPNVMLRGTSNEIARLLEAEDKPLFHRAARMAIPPGSVMKTITAVALLEAGVVKPEETFFCQGYLNRPDRQRCAIYRHFGIGHEEVDLSRALAESCNVYFFHHAARLGPERLVRWSRRFGFGAPTGIELPYEAAGQVPTPETIERLEGHAWRTADTQALAIGQSALTVTPLQIARAMAAIAGGGRLVAPHVIAGNAAPPWPIPGLHRATLDAVRQGMEQAVFDAAGTAHETVFLQSIPLAAKTGTAETGGNRPDHAWIAGYAPADAPRIAFAVALEHAGGGGEAAGPVAARLVARWAEIEEKLKIDD